jgi:hypothetical protein
MVAAMLALREPQVGLEGLAVGRPLVLLQVLILLSLWAELVIILRQHLAKGTMVGLLIQVVAPGEVVPVAVVRVQEVLTIPLPLRLVVLVVEEQQAQFPDLR